MVKGELHRGTMSKSPSTEHPSYACDPLALTPAQRDRHRELLTQLIGRRVGVREFPEGVALGFQRDATLRKKLEDWVSYERICCPFLTWTLVDEGVGHMASGNGWAGRQEFLGRDTQTAGTLSFPQRPPRYAVLTSG